MKADGDKLDEPPLRRDGDTASAQIEQPDGSANHCGAPSDGDANAEPATAPERLPSAAAALFARHPRLALIFAGKAEGVGADGQELGSPESYDLELATKLALKGVTDPDLLAAVLRLRPDGHARGSDDDYMARIIARALDVVGRDVADEIGDPDRAALPNIVIGVDEERVNDEAVAALATHPDVYCRGDALVQIATKPDRPSKAVRRQPGSPRIATIKRATIREMLASRAWWLRRAEKKLVPTHPPDWSVAAVGQRAGWPGVRLLEAVVETPVLRVDGTVLETPGYDAETGIYFKPPKIEFPPIPVEPTKDDAIRASDLLLEVVVDFPFATPAHKAAWLSGVLTPLARHAFDGPTPLTLIDGNCRRPNCLRLASHRSLRGKRVHLSSETGREHGVVEAQRASCSAVSKDARCTRAARRRATPVLDTACARRWELGIGSLGDPLVADEGGTAGAGAVPERRSL